MVRLSAATRVFLAFELYHVALKERFCFFYPTLKKITNLSGSKKINYFELPQKPWNILKNNLNLFLAVSHQSRHQIFLRPRQYVILAKKYIFSILHSFQEHKSFTSPDSFIWLLKESCFIISFPLARD